VPDGTTPPKAVLAAAVQDALDAIGCELTMSDCEVAAAAVVAALRLPERDRETAAKAWGEGHTTRWRRDPDDGCTCGAWASIECACGRYGSGELLSLNDNPYRASALREGRDGRG
jgi:hypothetical protein